MEFILGLVLGAIFSPILIKVFKITKDKLGKKLEDI